MQYAIEIDADKHYAKIRAWGPASMEEMRNLSIDLIARPSWHAGMGVLMDLTELETAHLSRADIRSMAESTVDFNEAMGDGKGALVVSGDLLYGLARMWSLYAEDRVTTNNRVFRSMREAREWLLGEADAGGKEGKPGDDSRG
jgi:hypothetical protein